MAGLPQIREVWADNLEEEMAAIRNIIDDFPFVSMVRASLTQFTHSGKF